MKELLRFLVPGPPQIPSEAFEAGDQLRQFTRGQWLFAHTNQINLNVRSDPPPFRRRTDWNLPGLDVENQMEMQGVWKHCLVGPHERCDSGALDVPS